MNKNLCKKVLSFGGSISPLIIPSNLTGGTGLMNPSIYVDGDSLIMNLRHVNYTLFHCEGEQIYNSRYGPLTYLNPENDIHLKTWNFFCKLNDDLSIKEYAKVDTSKHDKPPVWEFHGLEDVRLVRWDGKLYMIGVRRDTKPNGEGRMELSEIILKSDNTVVEISRSRIEPPDNPDSYCEKNWMPIIDMPYHFIKWTNPTEVVMVNPLLQMSEIVYKSQTIFPDSQNMRGGSQVIPWGDYRICIIHEVNMWYNKQSQKDAKYIHKFVVWDKSWNIIHVSEPFSLMDGEIEFCCGMAIWKEDLLITFGFQDNVAFILKVPKQIIGNIIGVKYVKKSRLMEITTTIPKNGCVVDCVFCPQTVLSNAYKGKTSMSFIDFKNAIDKLPHDVDIVFAGLSEPWINKDCTKMVIYANRQGHKVSVFTTAVGMTLKDVELIKNIEFTTGSNKGFVLHLPDKQGNAKHPVGDDYKEVLTKLKEYFLGKSFFYTISMGEVHDDYKELFPNTVSQQMWSRAGNLDIECTLKSELEKVKDKYIRTINRAEVLVTCNCEEGVHRNVLLPNGDVVLCCMDYGLQHVLGNLYTSSYNSILPKQDTPFDLCKLCENSKFV